MKRYYIIIAACLCFLILCSSCGEKTETMPKDANPFFVYSQIPDPEIEKEMAEVKEVNTTVPEKITSIIGKEQINIIAEQYPDFYSNLDRLFTNYEQGRILDLVNIFLNTKIKDEYLFNEELDKQIILNTDIEILSAIVSNNQLVLETKISYLPVLVNALSKNEFFEATIEKYNEYSEIEKQSEYFTLTFDILKYSKSEGIKIKDYKYKDYIIRALTNTLYDSKKYILEYSTENKQDLFDELTKDIREKKYENQEWMTEDIIRNLQENESFLEIMMMSFTIKSINNEYYIITYPDIKNCAEYNNMELNEIIEALNNEEINLISKIVHDPELNKLYNLIKNLLIV